jgi:CheY-like chemotaxis protein
MKYLIADDSKMARMMTIKILKKIISDEDEIIQAKDGQEAVDMHKEHNPDLTFMDLTMPVLNGFEAIAQITEVNKDAKIIVISADIQQGAIDKAKENGAVHFINKPINDEKVKIALEELGL